MPKVIRTVLDGHLCQADRRQSHYLPLPFDVPVGIARLDVRYSFSRRLSADQVGWRDGNIVDIGVFDARGDRFLSAPGFRGWSGSRRECFSIGAADATPGYLPGPMVAGVWQVVLGLYQIAADGCDYEVVITMEPGDESPPAAAPAPSRPGAPRGARWYRGDFHAHTWHSDGTASLDDLAAAARGQGLDFIAVTEHNTISHLADVRAASGPELLLIPGVEISTYRGHANVWPAESFVEFRCQSDGQMAAVREAVRARRALFSVNHPKEGGPAWEFGSLFEPDCIEVWGGPWFISNYQSLALWDEQLRQGKRIVAVGGSDKHVAPYSGESAWYDVGTPCTWVYADDLSTCAIMRAVRSGRVYLSATPAGPHLEMLVSESGSTAPGVGVGEEIRVSPGTTLRLECTVGGAQGAVLRLVSPTETLEAAIDDEDYSACWEVAAQTSTYWRPEIIESPEVPLDQEPAALMALALGNPVFVKTA